MNTVIGSKGLLNASKRIGLSMACVLLIGACSSDPEEDLGASSSGYMAEQKKNYPNLAYEHTYSIATKVDTLTQRYQDSLSFCAQAEQFSCLILNASHSGGENYQRAEIQLRIQNSGVKPLLDTALLDSNLRSENIRAEDLSYAIADTDKRLQLLQSYQQRLLVLENQADQDIESLMKVASELAKTQSEIETVTASTLRLQNRITLDLVTLSFYNETEFSFWHTLGSSVDGYAENLADGIDSAIIGSAYILPWLLILAVLFIAISWAWKLLRKKLFRKILIEGV